MTVMEMAREELDAEANAVWVGRRFTAQVGSGKGRREPAIEDGENAKRRLAKQASWDVYAMIEAENCEG